MENSHQNVQTTFWGQFLKLFSSVVRVNRKKKPEEGLSVQNRNLSLVPMYLCFRWNSNSSRVGAPT